MDFIEYLRDQEQKCMDVIRSNYTKPVNPADLTATTKRLEHIATALNLFDEYKERK